MTVRSKVGQVKLRQARPEDAQVVASLVDAAADGMFTAMLGQKEILAEASLTPGHQLSVEHAVVAVANGEILGSASAMTGAQARADSGQALAAAAGWRSVRMMVVTSFFRQILRFMDHHEDDDFYLLALAVTPEARDRGIGSMLLADVEQRAVAAGSTQINLDVDTKNRSAQRLYARQGFRPVAVSPRSWLSGAQVERWERPIGSTNDSR